MHDLPKDREIIYDGDVIIIISDDTTDINILQLWLASKKG